MHKYIQAFIYVVVITAEVSNKVEFTLYDSLGVDIITLKHIYTKVLCRPS